MEQHLDKPFLIIIILLLILIIGLIVVTIFLALNYFKKNSNTFSENTNIGPEKSLLEGTGICLNHGDQSSVGTCAICEEEYCSQCLKQIDSVNLCPEHFNVFANNTWKPITNQRTTPDTPEDGIYIYDFKRKLWADEKIPSYIVNEYKIQVENDYIETYVQLHVTEESCDLITEQLHNFKETIK